MSRLFEKNQIDLGNLFSNFPVLFESRKMLWELRENDLGNVTHLSFLWGGDRKIIEIAVSGILRLMAAAAFFPASVLKFYEAALDHGSRELREPSLENLLAV